MTTDLYQAILARTSVRRYAPEPLDGATLERVRDVIAETKPLVPGNRFEVLVKDVSPDEDLAANLGAYGRIITPPHYLVPYATGEQHLLEDLGYRVEQIAVRLAALGIGTCYIGSLGRETEVKDRHELPAGARIGAFLVFGTPSSALGGRFVNRALRTVVRATNKLPVERIFCLDSFATPAAPPAEIAPLVEAARNAPSAVNAQPWRFLWHGGSLTLFVERRNPKYGSGANAEYRLYDGGICMANVALALEAQGLKGRWRLLPDGASGPSDEGQGLPDHPEDLQPLARLDLAVSGRAA